jgi:hypothetical protein
MWLINFLLIISVSLHDQVYISLRLLHGGRTEGTCKSLARVSIVELKRYIIGDSSYRLNFDQDKKIEIQHHSWKERLRMSKTAKIGC